MKRKFEEKIVAKKEFNGGVRIFNRVDVLILFFILVLGFGLRMYKINTPLSDFHSWRQADTAAVARNFNRFGYDLLHPRYDDLSNVQTGVDNPEGYRFVEFPLYNAIFAVTYKYLPVGSLETQGRLVTVFFSLVVIACLYYLTRLEYTRVAAAVAALVYAVFPFFVYFSRVVLPETIALAFVMLSIVSLYRVITDRTNKRFVLWYGVSAIFFALSLLVKPTAIFFALTLLFLFVRRYGRTFFQKWPVYLYFILTSLPLIAWRLYITKYPEGVPASDWLITSVNTYMGVQNIFFKPAFFRWVFYERIHTLILGGFGSIFFIVGLLSRFRRYLLYSIALSSFAYLFVFQGGNVQHEYYQTLIFPMLAIFTGVGVSTVVENKKSFASQFITVPIICVLFAFAILLSIAHVKEYYNNAYAAELSQVVRIVNTFTKIDDKIVVDTEGDTTLLYLINRRGAPSIYHDLDDLKTVGYTYFITFKPDTAKTIKKEKNYTVVFENDKFSLFKL